MRVERPATTFPLNGARHPSPRASRFYRAAELEGRPVPEREWLVGDLIPMGQVTLLSGDGSVGKSLLALQLAVAVAAGWLWLRREVRQGSAIFLSAEDDDAELHRRLDTILRETATSYGAVQGLTLRSLAGEDALLATENELGLTTTALFDELQERAQGEAPTLICLDTLADVFPGNENERRSVRQFVGILRGLAMSTRCAVLLLAHPSLSGLSSGSGTSGSTAWSNSVRSRLYLERVYSGERHEPNPDRRKLTTKKANYARIGAELDLTYRAGMFVADEEPCSIQRGARANKAERVFLDLLDDVTAQGRTVNSNGGTTYAPTVFAGHPRAEGITKPAFRAALEALLATKRVRVAEKGPASRRVSYLQKVEQ